MNNSLSRERLFNSNVFDSGQFVVSAVSSCPLFIPVKTLEWLHIPQCTVGLLISRAGNTCESSQHNQRGKFDSRVQPETSDLLWHFVPTRNKFWDTILAHITRNKLFIRFNACCCCRCAWVSFLSICLWDWDRLFFLCSNSRGDVFDTTSQSTAMHSEKRSQPSNNNNYYYNDYNNQPFLFETSMFFTPWSGRLPRGRKTQLKPLCRDEDPRRNIRGPVITQEEGGKKDLTRPSKQNWTATRPAREADAAVKCVKQFSSRRPSR